MEEFKITSNQKALLVARASGDKMAEDILILDMKKISSITDFFVICSVSSDKRAKAVADNIIEELGKKGFRALRTEGYRQGFWIVLDYGDVVAHIFKDDIREFYNLEKLWADVPRKRPV